jgi:uncharacterized membrane-anchored protein YitT (DUF2179 family)
VIYVKKAIAIVVGSVLIACGIQFFLIPFKVLDGGIIGVGLIVNYISGMQVGLAIFLCSLPIFILAWFRYRSLLYNSVHGLIISSLAIDWLEPYQYLFLYYIELTPPSSALIGGMIIGTGIGVMLRYHTSTGGTDLLAQYMATTFSINVGIIILIMDAVIITIGGFLFSWETFMLSLLTISAGGLSTGIVVKK